MTNKISGFQPTWQRVDGDEWELGLDPVILVRVYRAEDGKVIDDGSLLWDESEWRGDWAVYR